ncbi:MAG TPA: Clp protease N-terminal domain-containing protein [Longimicrobiaceae bacterium]|nr:Clp protease N-terminal domain-containing protein [Longimicrobiaceae bacterium]
MFGRKKKSDPIVVPGSFTFTARTRSVLAQAREEAIRLQHDYVGTEHILLGLIYEGEGVSAAVLTNLGIESAQIQERIEEAVRHGKGATVPASELPYTSRAKKVIEFTMAEARTLSHSYVGTEHLLLGLLREERGIAAQVLQELGAPYERVRRETLRLLGVTAPPEEEEPGTSGFTVAIDDASDASIYEQIVAQVQEAIATGRLRPGERLPPVRRLADELDIAPGTVARAYSELERLGVVVTEGARGTRVAERRQNPLPDAERPDTLVGLLRPVAVAAFHLGATAAELRAALGRAMQGIFSSREDEA